MSYSGEGRSSPDDACEAEKNVNTTHILRDARKHQHNTAFQFKAWQRTTAYASFIVSRLWGVALVFPELNERDHFHLRLKT